MFGWFRCIFRSQAREAPQEIGAGAVLDALKALLARIESVDERQDRMEGQFRRLRGYVYAKKGDMLDTVFDEAGSPNGRKAFLEREARKRRLSKSELRELAGLVPLQTHHRPEQPTNE